MIKPSEITKFNRTEAELEEFLLFSIMVAGKNSQQTAKKLDSFLFVTMGFLSPLSWVEHLLKLENGMSQSKPLINCMQGHKLGQYDRLYKAFKGIVKFKNNLSNVTVQELESVHGIGAKTARFFVLHSRPNQQLAVLDTHILRWMRDQGIDAPKATPSGKKYQQLEQLFLDIAQQKGISVAELDLHIWKQYSQNQTN